MLGQACALVTFSRDYGSPLQDIKNLCDSGLLQQALAFAQHMDAPQACFPSAFNCILQGCIAERDLGTCREVHSLVIKHACESDTYVGSSLIRMYAQLGMLPEANLVFGKVSEPDVFAWGAIISAHSKNGQGKEAIKLYHGMKRAGAKPDSHVFVAVLTACAEATALMLGKLIHSQTIESGVSLNLAVSNALISMYGKCGSLEDARVVFDRLHRRDLVTWSAMIAGYSQFEHAAEALQLFQQLLKAGEVPDKVTFVSVLKACSGISGLEDGMLVHSLVIESGFDLNMVIGSTLIDFYAKCGSLEDACMVFNVLPKRDLVSWSSMIAGFASNNKLRLALEQYNDLQKSGLKPNGITFLCLLSACSDMGLVEDFDSLFCSMVDKYDISPTVEHFNCVVNLFGHSGRLKEAKGILQRMPFQSNIVGWTSLLNSCRRYGEVELARHCFNQIISIDCRDASSYVLMANIYAAAEMWEDMMLVNKMKNGAQAWKKPGKAFIHVKDTLQKFIVIDTDRVNACRFFSNFGIQLKFGGHIPLLDLTLDTEA